MKAIILNSGGLDSATAMGIAKEEGFALYSLTIDYGQRHHVELEAAQRVAAFYNVLEHRCLTIDFSQIAVSALTSDISVPKNRNIDAVSEDIPVTYVPARNILFLSLALAWADVLAIKDIFIGVHQQDASGYPDCREAFIQAFQRAATLGTRVGVQQGGVNIHTPLISMNKTAIIKAGTALGIDYSLTHSCYDPSEEGLACGHCDSCQFRRRGFQESGVPDPTNYA